VLLRLDAVPSGPRLGGIARLPAMGGTSPRRRIRGLQDGALSALWQLGARGHALGQFAAADVAVPGWRVIPAVDAGDKEAALRAAKTLHPCSA
jgi:hypothetical protein